MRKWKGRRYVSGIFLLALILCASGCGKSSVRTKVKVIPAVDQYEGNKPSYAVAAYTDLNERYKLSCFYKSSTEYELSFGVSGEKYEEVNVYMGTTVKKGQLLASLDTKELEEQIQQYKTQMSGLNEQKEHQEKMIFLLEKQVACAPDAETLSKAKEEKKECEAQLKQLNGQIKVTSAYEKEIQDKLTPRQIFSNIDGIVSFIKVYDSETLSQEGECFIKVVKDNYYFQSEIKEKNDIKVGMKASIHVGEQDYPAEVTQVDHKEGATICRYVLEDNTASFQMNTLGEASIPLKTYEHVLAIPSATIFYIDEKPCVRVLDDDGYQTVREVTLGVTAEDQTQVTDGLSDGEKVVR